MRIISFITETSPIKKILKYLDLWEESARDPPHSPEFTDEAIYVSFEDIASDRRESLDSGV